MTWFFKFILFLTLRHTHLSCSGDSAGVTTFPCFYIHFEIYCIIFKGKNMRIYYGSCRQIVSTINDRCFSCNNRQTRQVWRKLTCCTWAEAPCNEDTVPCLDPFPVSVFHIRPACAGPQGQCGCPLLNSRRARCPYSCPRLLIIYRA